MRYKRGIIVLSCAFLIGFLVVPIIVSSLTTGFTPNKQIRETAVHKYQTLKQTWENTSSQRLFRRPPIRKQVVKRYRGETSQPSGKIVSPSNKILATEFPIGWYVSIGNTDTLAKVANEKINIVMPYVGNSDEAKIMSYLDNASKAGVKVLLELPRSMVENQDTYQIIRFVRKFKNHPAVFAWYSADEPEFNQLSAQALENAYRAIKAVDSIKPVAVVFTRLWGIEKYLSSLDIFIWDQYPVTYGSQEFGSADWKKQRSWFRKAASQAQGKKGFWFVMQGYGEKHDGTPQFGKRLPTYNEERYMLYNAVSSGIDGLFLWAHYRSQQSWIDSVLTPLISEFHDYIPAIAAGKIVDGVKSDRSDIQVSLYQDPESETYYAIAINHGKRKLKAAIKLHQEVPVKFVKARVKEKYVRFARNNDRTIIKDVFTPYEVNIYQIN
jgi:hypothetical protein